MEYDFGTVFVHHTTKERIIAHIACNGCHALVHKSGLEEVRMAWGIEGESHDMRLEMLEPKAEPGSLKPRMAGDENLFVFPE